MISSTTTIRYRMPQTQNAQYAQHAQNSQPQQISLRDFFRNPDRAGYQISPDGSHISWLQPVETEDGQSRMNIHVQLRSELGDPRTVVCVTSETARDISGYFWKNNQRILYVKDFGGDENFHVVAVDRDGANSKDITPFDGVRAQIIDALEHDEANKDYILVGLNKNNPEIFDAYRLNIVTGELALVAENPGNITGWLTDHDGKIRGAATTDGVNTTLLYRDTEDEDFRPSLTMNFKETVDPLFFTFDNKHLYASSNLGRDKSAIVKFDLANAKELEVLFEHPDVDVSQLAFSRHRKVLTAISYLTWKRERRFLDHYTENLYNRVSARLVGYETIIADMTTNEDVMIVRTYSDRSLGAYSCST